MDNITIESNLDPIPVDQQFADTAAALPCYIDSIPDDTLYQIFMELVWDASLEKRPRRSEENHWDIVLKRSEQYIWTLAAICMRWRNVCLNNARLWSYINFHCTHDSTASYLNLRIRRIQLQLERSQSAPLIINAAFVCQCRGQTRNLYRVFEQSDRCEALMIDTYTFHWLDHTTARYSKRWDFPNLRKIDWDEDEDGHPDRNESYWYERFALGPGREPQEHLRIPWGQITVLILRYYNGTMDNLASLLAKCHNLVEFEFDQWEEGNHDTTPSPPTGIVFLPNLTVLKIYYGGILPILNTPSLRRLGLEPLCQGLSEAVKAFIQRTSCTICELEVAYNDYFTRPGSIHVDFAVPLLQALPDLKFLSFSSHDLDGESPRHSCEDIIQQMVWKTDPDSMGRLCPQLTHLEIRNLKFSAETMKQVLESRKACDGRLTQPSPLRLVEVFQPIAASQQKLESEG